MPSFSTNDLDGFLKWMRGGIEAASMRGFLSAAERTVEHITTVLIPGEDPPPVFMRAYAAGWHAEKTSRGADVVNTVPYASVIEHGARPENIKIGKAMIDALTEWVIRKGLVGKPKRGEARGQQMVDARNVAWAIAMHMKKVGIFNRNGQKGLRIAERAHKKAIGFVREEVKREIEREFGAS